MKEKEYYLYIDGKRVKVSEEVYREFYRGKRKERYFMEDLKAEEITVDPQTGVVTIRPGREDSYERLREKKVQFAAEDELMEDAVIRSTIIKNALNTLTPEEQDLIYELYFLEKTEREVSEALKIAKTTLRSKREAALDKLRRLLQKNF